MARPFANGPKPKTADQDHYHLNRPQVSHQINRIQSASPVTIMQNELNKQDKHIQIGSMMAIHKINNSGGILK